MGAAGSVPASLQDALAAGHSQQDVVQYQSILKLFEESERDAGGNVTFKSFLQTLAKHDADDELCRNLGVAELKEESNSIPAVMNGLHAAIVQIDGKHEGKASASDVVDFLAKFKAENVAPKKQEEETSSTPETKDETTPADTGSGGTQTSQKLQEPPQPNTEAQEAVQPAAVPKLPIEEKKETQAFVMEFSSVEMSQTSRPATSRRVPSRFRNRPITSRRPSKPAAAVAKPAPKKAAPKKPTSKTDAQASKDVCTPGTEPYKAIEELIEKTEADDEGTKKRGSFLQTLDKHMEDDELRSRLGLPEQGSTEKKPVSAFRGAFDEYVTAFTDKKHDGPISAVEVATFLTKYKHTVLRLLQGAC